MIPATAQGSPPANLSVGRAVEIALANNLELDRSAIDLASAKRQKDHSFAALLPTISASTGMSRNNHAYDSEENPVAPVWSQSLSYGISVSIAAGALANISIQKANFRNGIVAYDNARRSLEKDVRTAFYALLLQQENIQIQDQAISRSQKQYEQTLESSKAGLASSLDVLSSHVSLASLKPIRDSLAFEHKKQMGKFLMLLGMDPYGETKLIGKLTDPIVSVAKLESVGEGESFELRTLRNALAIAKLSRQSQVFSAILPTLSLSWNSNQIRNDAFEKSASWRDAAGGISVSVGYSFSDLFPWSSSSDAISGYDDQAKKYQSKILEQIKNDEFSRTSLIMQIRQSLEALDALELNEKLAQSACELAAEAYSHGTIDIVALRTAEGDLQKARYNVLAERLSLLVTAINFEYEENLPFGTILEEMK